MGIGLRKQLIVNLILTVRVPIAYDSSSANLPSEFFFGQQSDEKRIVLHQSKVMVLGLCKMANPRN